MTATGGVVPVTLPERLAQPAALTDVQYLVEIPGIPGDATLAGYAGWIESRSVDFALLGTDELAGAPARVGTIGVIAEAGSASPRLMEAVASGQPFTAPIKIAAVSTLANDVVEYARWKLDGASLVSYASASGRGDGFAITFDALHYSFADIGHNGRPLPPQTATLDRSAQGIEAFARDVELDAITPASDAKKLLARFPGAQGESQLVGYVGWTPVHGFQFQMERPLTASGDTSAPYATSFSILMPTGSSSPKLFELAALGTVLSEPIQVALVEKLNNKVLEFARWTLAGAEIGDYATAAATQDAVTVGYDQLTYQTQQPTIKGGMSAPIVGLWNAAAAGSQPFNAPLDPSDELVLANDVRLFVEFPDIIGDAQAVGYVGWVPVDSYAFDLTNPLDFAGTPALASAFRFSARSGQASPELQRIARGTDLCDCERGSRPAIEPEQAGRVRAVEAQSRASRVVCHRQPVGGCIRSELRRPGLHVRCRLNQEGGTHPGDRSLGSAGHGRGGFEPRIAHAGRGHSVGRARADASPGRRGGVTACWLPGLDPARGSRPDARAPVNFVAGCGAGQFLWNRRVRRTAFTAGHRCTGSPARLR